MYRSEKELGEGRSETSTKGRGIPNADVLYSSNE